MKEIFKQNLLFFCRFKCKGSVLPLLVMPPLPFNKMSYSL